MDIANKYTQMRSVVHSTGSLTMPRVGQTHSFAVRQRISEAARERHRAERERRGDIWQKQCSMCGEYKTVRLNDPRRSDFGLLKRKLIDGSRVPYPASRCRTCTALTTAWKKQGWSREELRAYNQHQSAIRDRDKMRVYSREYERRRRRENGSVERGPWMRYRNGHDAHRCNVDYLTLELPNGITEQHRIQSH